VKRTNQKVYSDELTLLCLHGGKDNAPKMYKRFTTVDSPERSLMYLQDDNGVDAIDFIALKDCNFVGFSVYSLVSKTDGTCHWRYKIGNRGMPEQNTDFSEDEVKDN